MFPPHCETDREAARDGFALVAALISVVLIGALIVGAFLATTEEIRVSGGEALSLRAMNSAESAVQTSFTGWASGQSDSLAVGKSVGRTVTADGLAVQTTLVRLDSSVFWLVAESGAVGGSAAGIRRRVGLFIRRVSDSAGRGSFLRLEERAWSELF